MHRAGRAVLVVVTRTPAPVVAVGKAGIDNLQRHRGPAPDAIVVRVEPARGKLKALAAGASAIRLPRAVEAALEEFLVHGAVVDAGASRPLPGIRAAITSATLVAIELW